MEKDEVTITSFIFDQYWVSANISRIDGLMSHEIEALVDYHWQLLLAEADRKEKDDE